MKTLDQIVELYSQQFSTVAPTREQVEKRIKLEFDSFIPQKHGWEFIKVHITQQVNVDHWVEQINTRKNERNGYLFPQVVLQTRSATNYDWNALLFKLFEQGYTLVDDAQKHRGGGHGEKVIALNRPDHVMQANQVDIEAVIDAEFKKRYKQAKDDYFNLDAVEKFVDEYEEKQRVEAAKSKRDSMMQLLAKQEQDADSAQALKQAIKQAGDTVKAADVHEQVKDVFTLREVTDMLSSLGYEKKRRAEGSVWVVADAE
ncbi:hypothetical protein BZJ19_11620 [Salinivibrio proteolyticus]|uniref:hypothetical protein n=1 Tax=Salinivibrio proteolyticus TaxID=334715 RepID=UPI00098964CD|nr:hypothetical protein [Salinivibrio proteolyticus]OOF24020.1 hypothetical protein BZJ19_11620 [Salinivibrio proteolyticus]